MTIYSFYLGSMKLNQYFRGPFIVFKFLRLILIRPANKTDVVWQLEVICDSQTTHRTERGRLLRGGGDAHQAAGGVA
jgi:hypothetical protein